MAGRGSGMTAPSSLLFEYDLFVPLKRLLIGSCPLRNCPNALGIRSSVSTVKNSALRRNPSRPDINLTDPGGTQEAGGYVSTSTHTESSPTLHP